MKKYLPWIYTHLAAFFMALSLVINPSLRKPITSYSGYIAVGFFVITLLSGPLKTIRPNWIWVIYLNRYRRELGVSTFSYGLIHMICFIIKRGSLEAAAPYLVHPAIIPAFWFALLPLCALAITSNDYSIRRLGFIKWKKLHSTVYMIELAIIIHMILVDQKFWAFVIFTPLIIMQAIRRHINKKFRN